jgi:hypothetical protein
MTEIYWLTRLDVVCIVSLTVFLVCTIWGIAAIIISDDSFRDAIARLKWVVVADVLALLILLFIPTTKDALVIYGLGTTKDWIESNEKAKEIPQKAIDALDKYLGEKSEKQ